MTSDFTAYQHVPSALKANRVIALAAVKQSARIFKSLPEDVKADREAGNPFCRYFEIDLEIDLEGVLKELTRFCHGRICCFLGDSTARSVFVLCFE